MAPRISKSARQHAKVENFSIGGVSGRFGPVGLMVYADHFLSAGKTSAADERFIPARLFLTCRAAELALKAFLSLKGCSLLQLAGGPFGHDLDALLVEAEKRDLHTLVKLEPEARAEICRASIYYSEKVFEYPALSEAMYGYPELPNATMLFDAVETLVTSLREPCLTFDHAK